MVLESSFRSGKVEVNWWEGIPNYYCMVKEGKVEKIDVVEGRGWSKKMIWC